MKKRTSSILAGVGIGLALLLGGGAFIKVTKNETEKTTASTVFSWEVGGLNAETGKKVSSTETARTKDYISIANFKVDVDEEQEVSYVLYLYNANKEFLECTTELTGDYTFADDYASETYNKEDVAYAKVVINPDDDDITAFELQGYVNDYKITTKK